MPALRAVSFKKPVTHQPRLSKPYVPGRHSKRFWTDPEDAVVRKYYPTGGVAAVLAHLPNRTRLGVYQRVNVLDVKMAKGARGKKFKIKPPEGFDDLLRAFYQNGDGKKRGECNTFADKHKLPRWWVTHRARKLGLTMPHKKEPPWTKAEEALLRKVPLHDTEKCSEIFRDHGFSRSGMAIRVRATRAHLSRRYRETLNANRIGKLLGIDLKTVTREIFAGRLKATKRATKRTTQQGGDWWSVTPADLRRWILDNLEYVDMRKVDKFAFVQIVAAEALST